MVNLPKLIDQYTYSVSWSEEDEEFAGVCAEFPFLSHLSSDKLEAYKGIIDLVTDVVNDLVLGEEREAPPEPFSTRSYSGRLQLRITPDFHRKLATKAAQAGVSLNRYINSKLSFS